MIDNTPNLQTIFVSIKYTDLSFLNKILETPEIPDDEKLIIKKFIQKCKELGYIISKETIEAELDLTITETHTPVLNITEYIDRFIAYKKKLKMAFTLQNLSTKILEDGINEETMTKVLDLTKSDATTSDYDELTDEQYLSICKGENIQKSNISTCVRVLDENLGGIQKGRLTSILGWTGSFKSTWALNIAYAAQLQGMNTLYLSLEMAKYDVRSSLYSRHSNQNKFEIQIPHLDLKQKKSSKKDLEYLETKIIPDYNELTGKIYIVDETDIGSYSQYALEQKFTEINNLAIQQTGHGIDICVVDHINLLKFGDTGLGVTDTVNKYTTFFRQQAINWCKTKEQVAMIVIAQSNREGRRICKKA